jgi:hypothetical protein
VSTLQFFTVARSFCVAKKIAYVGFFVEKNMIPRYEFDDIVDFTMTELRFAGEAAVRILGEWGFSDEEKIEILGFTLTEKFPDGSITDAHTMAISCVIDINNFMNCYGIDTTIICRPLGLGPFWGRDLKDAILAGGNEWGLKLALDFLGWLYMNKPWPFIEPEYQH